LPGIITEKIYTIHYYEIDSSKNCLLTTIADYFNDIAILQSENAGVGIEHLLSNKIVWVLYKWDIKINKMPKLFENVRVRTWSHCIKKFYAYRQFEIINEKNEVIITADSLWFLINTQNRRPIRVPDYMLEAYKTPKNEEINIDIEKLKAPTNSQFEKNFKVRYSDIDTNNHVNNVIYIDWALESIPNEIVTTRKLKNIIVTYEKETNYGETINSISEQLNENNQLIFNHSIINSNNETLTLVKTIWE